MRYPFVLLDVGQTLVGPSESFGATYARVYGQMGLDLPREALDRALRTAWVELSGEIPAGVDRYSYYPGGEAAYWLRFAGLTYEAAVGRHPDPSFAGRSLERLRAAFAERSAWVVFPDVPPVLAELKRAGVRLAVVSNWDSRLPQVLEMLGLREPFETLAVSHLEGVEKPNPLLFERALERLEARPEQALHVGDVPDLDLAGARAAGVDAVLVDREGRLPDMPALPDLVDLPQIAREGVPAGLRSGSPS